MTGRTPRESETKATEQALRWAQEEERARERAAVADVKSRGDAGAQAAGRPAVSVLRERINKLMEEG